MGVVGGGMEWNVGEEELGNVPEPFLKLKSSEFSLKGKAGVSSLAREARAMRKGVSENLDQKRACATRMCYNCSIYSVLHIDIYMTPNHFVVHPKLTQ